MLHGIHTALVTPFTASGAVDVPALERLCARQVDAGVHGLVAVGTTGEAPTLDDDEQALVVATTLAVAAGRVPVMAGVGTNSTRSTVRKVARAAEQGAAFGLLVLPYYNKPNPPGLMAHVQAAAGVGLPLVLYHVPGRTGQRLAPSELASLAGVPGVVAVKEATGDVRYTSDLLAACARPVSVLSGDDFTFLGALAQGAAGCISVLSNVAPRETVQVFDDFRAGRVAEAAAGFSALWPLITYLFTESNPVPCKAALAELGLCSGDLRLPLAASTGPSPRPMLRALGLC
jgi:4-hydroxy-tetrahydrodipicolinate synthase